MQVMTPVLQQPLLRIPPALIPAEHKLVAPGGIARYRIISAGCKRLKC